MSNIGLASNFVFDALSSFKMICLSLLDAAYAKVYVAKLVDRDWDENAITRSIATCIKNSPDAIRMHITPEVEFPLLTNELSDAQSSVDDSPRIDIMIGGFNWLKENCRIAYYMEAKNLYCQSFTKTHNTTPTSHTYYAQRYIDTGIDNLLKGHYPLGTLLLGYVLVGTVPSAVDLLNNHLTKASRKEEMISVRHQAFFPHLVMGQSNHSQGMMIDHCFLSFE